MIQEEEGLLGRIQLLEFNINESVDEPIEYPYTFDYVIQRAKYSSKRRIVYLKYYWKLLFIIAIFYGVPSIQFVVLQYTSALRGETYCYFNYACAKDYFGLRAFNNVFSNIGYILLGLFFIGTVRVRSLEGDDESLTSGLHLDMSLYYCLGWSLLMEGVFSGLYHVCPSKIDFQFDTTFMLIGAGLLFISVYQKRQPTFTSGAFKVFAYFAGIISLNVLSLLPVSYRVFWGVVFVLLAYFQITVSVHLYYAENFEWTRWKIFLRRMFSPGPPRDIFRFVLIVVGNLINFAFTIYFAISELILGVTQDFPSCVLSVMVVDSWLYLFYYGAMKYRYGEKVYLKVWVLFIAMVLSGVVAMYFYTIAVSNKFLTPEQSQELNKPCALFNFFDYHDIWHFLSALAVVLSYFVVYFLDDDIKDKPRAHIKVF